MPAYDFIAEILRGVDPLVVALTVTAVQALRWAIPGPDQGFAFFGRTFAVHPMVRRFLPLFPIVVGVAFTRFFAAHPGEAPIQILREGLTNGVVSTYSYNVLKTTVLGDGK